MSKPESKHNSDGGSTSATLEQSVASSQVSGGLETAAVVFSFAPFWAFTSTWHCKHPDSNNEQSFIQMSGPHTSDEVHAMYKNRQMKGSNLVVGLSSSNVKCEDIPPSFLRTLSYVFEIAKSGGSYRPMTPDDLIRKIPAPGWCRPLWHSHIQQQYPPASNSTTARCSSDGGRSDITCTSIDHLHSSDQSSRSSRQGTGSDSSSLTVTAEHDASLVADLHNVPLPAIVTAVVTSDPATTTLTPSLEGVRTAQSSITDDRTSFMSSRESDALFTSAPFWCYLYSHEPSRAKKTPPKTADQMMEMMREGCLPDWTPVLGLAAEVSTFNSLPPALFMPLASLMRPCSNGAPYRAITQVELTMWDKFKDTRAANGSTQGVIQAAGSGGHTTAGGPLHRARTTSSAGFLSTSRQQRLVSSMSVVDGSSVGVRAAVILRASSVGIPPAPPAQETLPSGASALQHIGMVAQGNMWYGGGGSFPAPYPPHQHAPSYGHMYPGAVPAPHPGPGFADPNAYPPQPRQRSESSRQQVPPPLEVQQAEQRSFQRPMLDICGTPTRASSFQSPLLPQPRRWRTAVFRLFTADASRGPSDAAWWYLAVDPATGGSTVAGPMDSEQMIFAYARGNLGDAHYACGTAYRGSIPSGAGAPPQHLFELIGTLLFQVEQGGEYILLPVNESSAPSSVNTTPSGSNRPSLLYSPASGGGARPGGGSGRRRTGGSKGGGRVG